MWFIGLPTGVMLICVSNVEHWRLTERLLRGDFRYQDSGLFDHRHVTWFSLESMGRALDEAGLRPVDVQPRTFDEAEGRAFIGALEPGLRNLGIDPAEYARTALPLQYAWRAGRAAVPRMVIAADLLRPIGGVSHLRVIHPVTAMGTQPGVVTHFAAAGMA